MPEWWSDVWPYLAAILPTICVGFLFYFIIKAMNRSATVEKAYGAYTHHELSVLVTVLTRRQALQLRNFLRENDPHSFITIVNSSEIIGKGFRSFN